MEVAMSIVYFKTFWLGLHKEADRIEAVWVGRLVDFDTRRRERTGILGSISQLARLRTPVTPATRIKFGIGNSGYF
jgi:hypothetical protein